MGRFEHTSRRTHDREGRCSLCGNDGVLTDTHIPPKAAFNSGRVRRSVVNEDNELVLDRGRDGGFSVWGHCEECRAATSPWDDEYIAWARQLAPVIVSSTYEGQRSHLAGTFERARPGRFAHAAVAGMTAIAEGLIDSHPEFVEALRAGVPLEPTGSLRLLAGVVSLSESPDSGGGHGGVVIASPLTGPPSIGPVAMRPTISAYIHHFPFSLVLVDDSVAGDFPHRDCTSWLSMGVEEGVEPFRLELPAVRVSSKIVATAEAFEAATI